MIHLFLYYNQAEKHKENADKKINEHKHTILPFRRSQRFADIENVDEEMDIAHDDVQMGTSDENAKIDVTPTDVLPDIGHLDEQPDEHHKENPLESTMPPHTIVVVPIVLDEIGGSTKNIDGGSREDVPTTIKRQRLSQTLCRSIEKKEK